MASNGAHAANAPNAVIQQASLTLEVTPANSTIHSTATDPSATWEAVLGEEGHRQVCRPSNSLCLSSGHHVL